MSLGLIADDLIQTRTEKQNKKETNISVDANLVHLYSIYVKHSYSLYFFFIIILYFFV